MSDADWIDLLQWRHLHSREALYEQIAVGDLLPQLVANHLFAQSKTSDEQASERLIQGTEGVDVKYAHCCNPVLGDPIQGHLSRRGLIVHRARCHNLLHEQHLHPENIMSLHWTSEQEDDVNFIAYLGIDLILSDEQISEMIYLCRKAKTGVESVRAHEGKTYVNIVVNNRKQIAQIIRELRMQFGFPRITRLTMPVTINEPIKAKAC